MAPGPVAMAPGPGITGAGIRLVLMRSTVQTSGTRASRQRLSTPDTAGAMRYSKPSLLSFHCWHDINQSAVCKWPRDNNVTKLHIFGLVSWLWFKLGDVTVRVGIVGFEKLLNGENLGTFHQIAHSRRLRDNDQRASQSAQRGTQRLPEHSTSAQFCISFI